MTRLAALVDASRRVAETGSRLGKRDAIAACLRARYAEQMARAAAA